MRWKMRQISPTALDKFYADVTAKVSYIACELVTYGNLFSNMTKGGSAGRSKVLARAISRAIIVWLWQNCVLHVHRKIM